MLPCRIYFLIIVFLFLFVRDPTFGNFIHTFSKPTKYGRLESVYLISAKEQGCEQQMM